MNRNAIERASDDVRIGYERARARTRVDFNWNAKDATNSSFCVGFLEGRLAKLYQIEEDARQLSRELMELRALEHHPLLGSELKLTASLYALDGAPVVAPNERHAELKTKP
jgi:hypothetical protein